MKNILIIGCGLLGSSLLRRIQKKRISKKIYIYEKSKSNIAKIKKFYISNQGASDKFMNKMFSNNFLKSNN